MCVWLAVYKQVWNILLSLFILLFVHCKVESGPCCLPDISVGFVWPIAPVGTTVQRICDNIHSNFHPLTYARRTCLSGAVWGPVDVSGCTVLNHNTATIAIVVVANITASRLAVEANLSALVDQVRIRFNVTLHTCSVWYIHICVALFITSAYN